MLGVTHYADFLRQQLQERLLANPRYSLRAFSRDLGLAPSKLSEVLNRKQGLSVSTARKICKRLGLSAQDSEIFCKLVVASDARSKRERLAAQASLAAESANATFLQIQDDTFKIISDWYHYAILELLQVSGFESNTSWIAKRLGVSKFEVDEAIKRLARLELIEVENGTIRSTGVQLTTSNGIPSESIRKFNKQVLEKALQAITLQTVDERDIGSLTTAVHTDDLPRIKELIRRQRREFNQFISECNRSRKPNEVYCLATQFFRITNPEDMVRNGE